MILEFVLFLFYNSAITMVKGLTTVMQKTDYINEINNLLPLADEEFLDFLLQLLQKSVSPSLIEMCQRAV